MIRYYEEEIDLNEIFLFRLDISAYPDQYHEIYLEIELIGSDISKIGKPMEHDDETSEKGMFEKVSSFKCQLNYEKIIGIHEFLPIIFDENHFCVCNATIHTLLLDYKFRLNEVQLAIVQKVGASQELKHVNKENKGDNIILLQPKNFTEFLYKATKKCIYIYIV